MFKTISFKIDKRGVGTLMLNRPEKHNALSSTMINELAEVTEIINNEKALRVVVLRGDGPSFCAGADLKWMQEQMEASAEQRGREAKKLANMLGGLNLLLKPLIGLIHGNVFGGGVGLACVCDVVVAIDDSKFGFTETRLGLIPATIGPYVIRRMTEAKARTVFMSSRIFGANEAKDFNIVNRITKDETKEKSLELEVLPYLDCDSAAVEKAKELALRLSGVPSKEEIDYSVSMLVRQWESEGAKKGIKSFFEKKLRRR
jgi:methylglutaconyl-CoA hydratase